jgi:hypothetical protein
MGLYDDDDDDDMIHKSNLVSPPTSPLAKLSLGTDFPQVLGASFRYLATSPLANISAFVYAP